MSKELLLTYAKGGKMEPKYNVAYTVNPDTGEITILSCEKCSMDLQIHIVHTKKESELEVSKEAMDKAIDEFLKKQQEQP